MFNSEKLLLQQASVGNYEGISGQITAEATDISTGFLRGSYGSSTNASLQSLYDSFYNGINELVVSVDAFDEYDDPQVFVVGGLNLYIQGEKLDDAVFILSAQGLSSGVTRVVKVVSRNVKYKNKIIEQYNKSSSVVSSEEVEYPLLVEPTDITWIKSSIGMVPQRGLSFTETALGVGDHDYGYGGDMYLSPYGFEDGKTYDFSLEYKIDAIITEDGVQTF